MFKKLLYISFSIMLLTITAGFTISKHYCGLRLVSVSIDHEAESCCDMQGTSDCCHNETKTFQFHENFIIAQILHTDNTNSIDLFIFNFILLDINSVFEQNQEVFITESPPPKNKQTILSSLQSYLC